MSIYCAEIRISGQDAIIRGKRPFTVQAADPSGQLEGFVMVDHDGMNCVRFTKDGSPVIFTDEVISTWMATDLNRR
jgi:hypothetical protein